MATDTGVSIQSSIKLGKIALIWNLARVFAYLPPLSRLQNGFDFYVDGVTVKTSDKSRSKCRKNVEIDDGFWIVFIHFFTH